MISSKQKTNWLINLILMIAFLVSFFLEITGIEIHQWLGIAIFLVILVHLLLHQNWVVTVTNKFFGSIPFRTRIYALLDGLLFLGFSLIVFTGLIMSTWFNLALSNYDQWFHVHLISSICTLIFLVIKILSHWKMITRAFEKFAAPASHPQIQPQPVLVGNEKMVSRRQFLATMGVVGLGSAVALGHGLSRLRNYGVETIAQAINPTSTPSTEVAVQSTAEIQTATPQPASTATTIVQPSATATSQPATQVAQVCNYLCRKGKHCSYPGSCHDYRDSNGNNLCDLGECA